MSKELLTEVSVMDLRDQLEAKEQMIKTREKVIDEQQQIIQDLTHKFIRAKWWLKEIVENHRFTPISTAEKALKELTENEE